MIGALITLATNMIGGAFKGVFDQGLLSIWNELGTGVCLMLFGAGLTALGLLMLTQPDEIHSLAPGTISVGVLVGILGWALRR